MSANNSNPPGTAAGPSRRRGIIDLTAEDVQDFVIALAVLTSEEDEYELFMDLASRRIAWAEDLCTRTKIRADVLASFEDACFNDNHIERAFYFAAFSHVENLIADDAAAARALAEEPKATTVLSSWW